MIYNVDDDGDDDEENVAEDDVEDENVAEEEVEWMMMLRRIGDQDDNAEDEFEDD
jgi:hypothetical protein